jgi:hypothetical protein
VCTAVSLLVESLAPARVELVLSEGQPGHRSGRKATAHRVRNRDEHADALAAALGDALSEKGGWYCDFRSADETFVVFAGRSFRYRRGDAAARADAEEFGRSVGVPEAQLDWPE